MYTYDYVYTYAAARGAGRLREGRGAVFGCFLQALRGDTYFTELAERAEYGNHELINELVLWGRLGSARPNSSAHCFIRPMTIIIIIGYDYLC